MLAVPEDRDNMASGSSFRHPAVRRWARQIALPKIEAPALSALLPTPGSG